MSDLTGAAAQAIEQPHGDVITILLEQHRRIRELFAHVKRAGEDASSRPSMSCVSCWPRTRRLRKWC